MKPMEIEKRICENWPGSTVMVQDLTGTMDHYQVVVASPVFEGKTMIDQHRMVQALFKSEIASDELHALSLKTFTPAQWAAQKGK